MLTEELSSRSSPSPVMIRRAREAAGLTRPQAAALASISPRTLEAWEHGRYPPRRDRWEHLREKLSYASAEERLRARLETVAREFRAKLRNDPGLDAAVAATTGAGRPKRDHRYATLVRTSIALAYPRPTLRQIASWTGLGYFALQAWLKSPRARSHRPMPRYAARLVLLELAARDRGGANWSAMLRMC